MVARVISQDERSRAMSFIFGGLHVGSLLGLFVAPPLIERFGWPTVFYAFGLLGADFCLASQGSCLLAVYDTVNAFDLRQCRVMTARHQTCAIGLLVH